MNRAWCDLMESIPEPLRLYDPESSMTVCAQVLTALVRSLPSGIRGGTPEETITAMMVALEDVPAWLLCEAVGEIMRRPAIVWVPSIGEIRQCAIDRATIRLAPLSACSVSGPRGIESLDAARALIDQPKPRAVFAPENLLALAEAGLLESSMPDVESLDEFVDLDKATGYLDFESMGRIENGGQD